MGALYPSPTSWIHAMLVIHIFWTTMQNKRFDRGRRWSQLICMKRLSGWPIFNLQNKIVVAFAPRRTSLKWIFLPSSFSQTGWLSQFDNYHSGDAFKGVVFEERMDKGTIRSHLCNWSPCYTIATDWLTGTCAASSLVSLRKKIIKSQMYYNKEICTAVNRNHLVLKLNSR